MKRKERKRPYYPVTVFSFHLEPHSIPQQVWDTAKEMQALWNLMTEAHKRILEQTAEMEKPQKVEPYRAFYKEVYNLTKAAPLNAGCKWDVHDRFIATLKRFHKKQGGPPKFKKGLDRVRIVRRFFDGGRPIEWLFSRTSDRQPVRLRQVAENRQGRLMRGFFNVGDEQMDFEAVQHRAIPQGSFLKQIALTGRLIRAFNDAEHRGWQWSLNLTVEIPPQAMAASVGRVAALDVGWRVRGDYLRIGLLTDTDGNLYELRLPFDLSNRSARRCEGGGYQMVSSFKQMWEIESEQDEYLESVKERVRPRFDEMPEELRPDKGSWHKVREGGLRRLLWSLVEANACPDVREILTRWRERNGAFEKQIAGGRERMLKRREWMYRNIAAWIADRYDELVWEGDFNLSTVAADDTDDPALKAAQRYRQMAALYTLRQAIGQAMRKRGRVIVESPAAYSTQTCSICKAHVPSGADLILRCESGHLMDQDVNAARIMLGERVGELRAMAGVSTSVDRSQVSGVVVPLNVDAKVRG